MSLRNYPGRILLVCQKAVANPGRHVTINYYSDDLGKKWQAGDVIDHGEYGGYGDHGGGIEGTVLEKQNGELKLLLRLPRGCFQEVTSKDGAGVCPDRTPFGPRRLAPLDGRVAQSGRHDRFNDAASEHEMGS